MVILSSGLGALCGSVGIYLSFFVDVSSGASVVLFSALLFVLALAYTGLLGYLSGAARRASGADPLSPSRSGTFD